ncbi:MAG TPA: glycosyltransferase family 2 protein [Rhodoglobus sp.]|nr:glycosyltransferase family 2 protein [Rhodoglobus sp.]
MQPRVTAVLIARNGAQYLPKTLAALAAQTRRPDRVIPVDVSSTDLSPELMLRAYPSELVRTPGRSTFGGALSHALASVPSTGDDEWLWLLGHDNAPTPGALSALLGAVEVAPSVAVAGPKLMSLDSPDLIVGFGETMTRLGRSLPVVANELDQAQHDVQSDLLGVAASGMLVRRSVFTALGGFDPGLPSVDAALDFCVRARLAGHRVIGVPSARVASAGPIELFGRKSLSAGAQNRIRRSAQLHRRMTYTPGITLVPHWLTLVPLAVLRSLAQLIAKRPGSVGGELAAGLGAAFDGSVGRARRGIRRTRVLGWASIAALRMPPAELRERRAHDRAVAQGTGAPQREGPGFFAGGGAWVVLVAAVAGFIVFGRFINAQALAGGGLVPLSATVGELWSHVGYGWRDIGAGFTGAADPFAYVLAVLGTITFWNPSFSVVLIYLLALPLAALTAWLCAARFSTRGWGPAVAAIIWTAAPPFLVSLGDGQLGAVIAHILLPALVLAVVSAARSWAAAAGAALLFAVVAASAPVLVPALVLLLLVWMAARPTSIHRLVGIVIPAAALFAPLVVQQLGRGNWLALFATPGHPVISGTPSGLQLAIGSPSGGLHGWDAFLDGLGIPAGGSVVVVVALAPLAVLALLSLFLPGSRRSIPAMLVALLGFVTAVIAAHIDVTLVGSQTTSIWVAPALSLYWLGLAGAVMAALESLATRATVPAFLVSIGVVALAVPLFAAAATGQTAVAESNGRLLPAFVSAEAATNPGLGTLQLSPEPGGGIATTVHRGLGTTLDEQSTLDATDTAVSEADARLATLAGNLASRSGFDIAAELDALQLGFVLVPDGADEPDRVRLVQALDGNRLLNPIGETANGFLWHYEGLADGDAPSAPGATGTSIGTGILVGQGIIVALTLLLAIPTSRRRRVRTTGARDAEEVTDSE